MTEIYIIYKIYFDELGKICKLEVVEGDKNESEAIRYTKLYNLQRLLHERNTIKYEYLYVPVIK